MLVVGLTGGIGAGKSTVAALLAERGASIVDADLIARQVVDPGGSAYEAMVERFGAGVVGPDGRLDRAAIAAVVFADGDARRDLEAITHPAIRDEMAAQMLTHAGEADAVVVLDIPLLKERQAHMAGVIVVDVDPEVAVERLVRFRGFDEEDARRRIAAQITRAERNALADVLVDNSGDRAHLEAEV